MHRILLLIIPTLMAGWRVAADCRVQVVATVTPADAEVRFFVESSGTRHRCSRSATGCELTLYGSFPRTLTVLMEAWGYKTQRRNILDPICVNRKSVVSIGPVRMEEAGIPRVVQVIKSKGPNATVRVQLVISNPRDRQTLVSKVSMVGSDTDLYIMTGCNSVGDTYYEYKVSGRLEVGTAAGTEGGAAAATTAVAGTVVETTEDKRFEVDWQGLIETSTCNIIPTISMTFPVTVALRPSNLTVVSLVLPSHFSDDKGQFGFKAEDLDYFAIELFSDDAEAPTIPARYGKHPQRQD